jgi:hypothetical protein
MSISTRLIDGYFKGDTATYDLKYTDPCTATVSVQYHNKSYRITLVDDMDDMRKFYLQHVDHMRIMKENGAIMGAHPAHPLDGRALVLCIAQYVVACLQGIAHRPTDDVLDHAAVVLHTACRIADGITPAPRSMFENSILLIASNFIINSDFAAEYAVGPRGDIASSVLIGNSKSTEREREL